MTTGGIEKDGPLEGNPTSLRQVGQKNPQASTIVQKWRHYSTRYGRMSALLRYVGRCCPLVWPLLGRPATSTYLKRWKRESGAKVLNLGGGGNLREEWLTADVSPRADVFVDCCKTLPFADGTIDGLMLEEVIEHLDYQQGLRLLRECNRVLRNEGLLRVSTPDLSWFAELQRKPSPGATQQSTADFANREGCRFLGISDAPDELIRVAALNSIFLCHGHRFVYTSQSLEELLGMAGFQFRRSIYRDTYSRLARFDTHAERFSHPPEISLYYDVWKIV